MSRETIVSDASNALRIQAGVLTVAAMGLPLVLSYFPARPGAAYWAEDVAVTLVPVAILVAWLHHRGVSPGALGLAPPRRALGTNEATVLTALCFLAFWLIEPVGFVVGIFFGAPNYESAFVIPGGGAGVLAITYYSISAGLSEEILFRAIPAALMIRPDDPASGLRYIIVSSVAFGAFHAGYGVSALLSTAVVSLVASALYIAIRNVWPFVIGHAAYDLWAFTSHLPGG